jgi:hypothetical protein
MRFCTVTVADVAVESAEVVYALSQGGGVTKTTDAGFLWSTPAKATGLTDGYSLKSLGPDLLIAGALTTGEVAYSTNGNSSWTKVTANITPGGHVRVAADGLADGDHIYAVANDGGTAAKNVNRWTIGTSTTWTKLGTATAATFNFTGIALADDGTLYAIGWDPMGAALSNSDLYRAASPTATTVTFDVVPLSDATTGTELGVSPQGFRLSPGSNKLWAIDTVADKLYVYTDTLVAVGPTLAAPADNWLLPMNPATGTSQNIFFSWTRPSKADDYDIEIASDSAFLEKVYTGSTGTDTSATVIKQVGPQATNTYFSPTTTYYWRVRATCPLHSPWSEVRTFTTTTLVPWVPEVNAPQDGATGVLLRPSFAWTAVEGANQYELEIATNSQFADPIKSLMLDATVYGLAADLEYSTTYYMRVRALKTEGAGATFRITERGEWVNSVFTTMDEPPPPPEPEPEPEPPIIVLPEAETPAYIWAIIGIGGVLIIAVIVLIVRTRRQV